MWTTIAGVVAALLPAVLKMFGVGAAPPADDQLGRVKAATDAVKKVDPSQKAIDADVNNLDR